MLLLHTVRQCNGFDSTKSPHTFLISRKKLEFSYQLTGINRGGIEVILSKLSNIANCCSFNLCCFTWSFVIGRSCFMGINHMSINAENSSKYWHIGLKINLCFEYKWRPIWDWGGPVWRLSDPSIGGHDTEQRWKIHWFSHFLALINHILFVFSSSGVAIMVWK